MDCHWPESNVDKRLELGTAARCMLGKMSRHHSSRERLEYSEYEYSGWGQKMRNIQSHETTKISNNIKKKVMVIYSDYTQESNVFSTLLAKVS